MDRFRYWLPSNITRKGGATMPCHWIVAVQIWSIPNIYMKITKYPKYIIFVCYIHNRVSEELNQVTFVMLVDD